MSADVWDDYPLLAMLHTGVAINQATVAQVRDAMHEIRRLREQVTELLERYQP